MSDLPVYAGTQLRNVLTKYSTPQGMFGIDAWVTTFLWLTPQRIAFLYFDYKQCPLNGLRRQSHL